MEYILFCKVQLCILYTGTLFQSKGGWTGGAVYEDKVGGMGVEGRGKGVGGVEGVGRGYRERG